MALGTQDMCLLYTCYSISCPGGGDVHELIWEGALVMAAHNHPQHIADCDGSLERLCTGPKAPLPDADKQVCDRCNTVAHV